MTFSPPDPLYWGFLAHHQTLHCCCKGGHVDSRPALYSHIMALVIFNHLHASNMFSLTIWPSKSLISVCHKIMPNSLSSTNDQHKATKASLPITNKILTGLAYTALLIANTFPCTTELWEKLDPWSVDKTWSPRRLPTLVPTRSVATATSTSNRDANLGPANQASQPSHKQQCLTNRNYGIWLLLKH